MSNTFRTAKGDESALVPPMELRRLVIIGAGGHGRELYAAAKSAQRSGSVSYEVIGFVDDGSPDPTRLERLGAPLLGRLADVPTLEADYIIGIGNGRVRRTIDEKLQAAGARVADPIVHSGAWIGPDVTLGLGVVVCFGASVTTNVRIGRHVHLNRGATVGHDCRIGDFVTMAPLSTISGNVTLEDGSELGAASCVIPGVTVGHNSRVGAGAAVIADVPPGVIAVGVPARSLNT